MEPLALSDKDEYPDDNVLLRHLGKAKPALDVFLKYTKEKYPASAAEWRYYNDGKSWLLKITKKAKTLCWVAVGRNMFRTGFYFSDKANDLIRGSSLGKEYKDQFTKGKRFGKIRAVSVEIRKIKDVETSKILLDIKDRLK